MAKQGKKAKSMKRGREPFGDHIEQFVQRLESLEFSFPVMIGSFQRVAEDRRRQLEEFVGKHGKPKPGKKKQGVVLIPPEHVRRYERLRRAYGLLDTTGITLRRTCIVSLVSFFDALVGQLARSFLKIVPEKLDSSARSIKLSQLTKLGSVKAAREHVIEGVIDTVLRGNHAGQIAWLSEELDVTLEPDRGLWSRFIEVTERRNLFIHSDGRVSTQYLSVCAEHGAKMPADIVVGTLLDVEQAYFRDANATVLEMGVKLGHVIWRKLLPGDSEEANSRLIQMCLDLIDNEEYALARKLLEFPEEMPGELGTGDLLLLGINIAQTYKWEGDEERCREVLAKTDWDAHADKFRLAWAVLEDRFDDAVPIMERIGAKGGIDKDDYRTWPLFKEFRKSRQFKRAFLAIFGEEVKVTRAVKKIGGAAAPGRKATKKMSRKSAVRAKKKAKP